MIDERIRKNILKIASRYPCKDTAILPALNLVQREKGYISKEDMRDISRILGFSEARIFSVASFYSRLRLKRVGRYHIQVCSNVSCHLSGSDVLFSHISNILGIDEGEITPDGLFSLERVECLGSCGYGPAMQINCTHFENINTEDAERIIDALRDRGELSPLISEHRAIPWDVDKAILLRKDRDKYTALRKALTMSPEEITGLVIRSGLRGRGGAGFPAGVKWRFIPEDRRHTVYLICNADEGEPGTFKDREIMEHDPHLLIEGMLITAYAIGAHHGFIYIRGEYNWIALILLDAIDYAMKHGFLGRNILDSGFSFYIDVFRSAGSYVCGEETALMESIEGRPGRPRLRPPYPATRGLYDEPTVIHNVTTLAYVPFIIERGPDAFIQIAEKGSGTKLFGISGHVRYPGLYEYPMGTPLRRLIYDAAGGIRGGKKLKAVIPGGLSSPILRADEIDIPMDFESLFSAGSILGSGGIIVFDEDTPIPEIALRTSRFFAHESCGQCAPCREGTSMIYHLMRKIVSGRGSYRDIDLILELCDSLKGTTICAFGRAASAPVEAMIRKFEHEFTKKIYTS